MVVDYYGDGLEAMWNAPTDQPDQAVLACKAALAAGMRVIAVTDSYTAFQDPAGIPGFGPEQVAKGLMVNKGADQMFAWAAEHEVDMFAGSGALGLEALSRGAERAVFVERGRRAAEAIRENIDALGLTERARVLQADVRAALSKLSEASLSMLGLS